MRTLITLKLYTTSHCHLCEHAIELIKQLDSIKAFELIDIMDDDILLASFGTRIPVLQRNDNLLELDWPFSLHDVKEFINL